MSINNLYNNFSVEELLHHQDFILEVKNRNDGAWNDFVKQNSENQKNIIEAKKILGYFEVNTEILDLNRRERLWHKINNHQNKDIDRKIKRIIPLYSKISAAVVLLILLVNGGYFLFLKSDSKWVFEDGNQSVITAENKSVLFLPDGNEVLLKEKDSNVIVLDEKNAVQINNDSIISIDKKDNSTININSLTKIVVPYGESAKLQLSDGTRVWLNAGSQLAFPTSFNGVERKVFLEGEGYFEVAKNEQQKFIVETRKISINVYGTKFNLSSYLNDELSEVVLLEGSVSVKENKSLFKKEAFLIPGQKASYNNLRKTLTTDRINNPEYYISWIEGWYHFSDAEFFAVLRKLERFYNVQFEYDHELVKDSSRISGKLDLKESVDDVLQILCKVAGVNYQIEEQTIIISALN